uniref:BAH domain-containing protein n=1 Tax=Auxenochlorella protothecoides TaxID=3075 RepID=A0A1D2AEQ5_AUXPR
MPSATGNGSHATISEVDAPSDTLIAQAGTELEHGNDDGKASTQYLEGEYVLLQFNPRDVQPSIGQLYSFQPGGAEGEPMKVMARCFFRPTELSGGTHVPDLARGEVFFSEKFALCPLDSVKGRCKVFDATGEVDQNLPIGENEFVCRREYLSARQLLIPLDAEKAGKLDQRPVQVLTDAQPVETTVHATKKRRGNEVSNAGSKAGSERSPTASSEQASHRSSEDVPTPTQQPTPSASVLSDLGTGDSGTPRSRPGAPAGERDTGRWSRRRYEAALAALTGVLQRLGALTPVAAVLRPVLRDAARRVIGDTGLLDHLLKHQADRVVGPRAQRLRRRHNHEGHMEYWLQSPEAATAEDALLRKEVTALTSELRDVKEVRHALHAVRAEAAQVLHEVSTGSALEEGTGQAAGGGGGNGGGGRGVQGESVGNHSGKGSRVVGADIGVMQRQFAEISKRIASTDSVLERVLKAAQDEQDQRASMTQLFSSHMKGTLDMMEDHAERQLELENQVAQLREEGAGRLEALSAAAQDNAGLRAQVETSDARLRVMEHSMLTLLGRFESLQNLLQDLPRLTAQAAANQAASGSRARDASPHPDHNTSSVKQPRVLRLQPQQGLMPEEQKAGPSLPALGHPNKIKDLSQLTHEALNVWNTLKFQPDTTPIIVGHASRQTGPGAPGNTDGASEEELAQLTPEARAIWDQLHRARPRAPAPPAPAVDPPAAGAPPPPPPPPSTHPEQNVGVRGIPSRQAPEIPPGEQVQDLAMMHRFLTQDPVLREAYMSHTSRAPTEGPSLGLAFFPQLRDGPPPGSAAADAPDGSPAFADSSAFPRLAPHAAGLPFPSLPQQPAPRRRRDSSPDGSMKHPRRDDSPKPPPDRAP